VSAVFWLTPLGILGIALIVITIGLFIWNIHREELSHEDWVGIRDKRRPDLACLISRIEEYMRATYKVTKSQELNNIETYYTGAKPSALVLFKNIVSSHGNMPYLRAKADNISLGIIRTDIEDSLSRISSRKLNKLIQQFYRREHIARSYQIFKTIYRTEYSASPSIERLTLRSDSIGDLATYLKTVYTYISIMERGKELE
jgi:hypothetical protein